MATSSESMVQDSVRLALAFRASVVVERCHGVLGVPGPRWGQSLPEPTLAPKMGRKPKIPTVSVQGLCILECLLPASHRCNTTLCGNFVVYCFAFKSEWFSPVIIFT